MISPRGVAVAARTNTTGSSLLNFINTLNSTSYL
jgi:hypothetical protein